MRVCGASRASSRAWISEIVEQMGLSDVIGRPVGTYSGGQRRRLEIGRALVSQPRVLFLDEPTVGLDPRIRYELLDVIGDLRTLAGTTILLTTHYLDEAERLCDRVAIVHAGQIVALDRPEALLSGLGHEIIELRVRDDPDRALEILRGQGIAGVDAFAIGSSVTVPLHHTPSTDAIAIIGGLGISASGIATRPPTLDDVYLRLTGGRLAA